MFEYCGGANGEHMDVSDSKEVEIHQSNVTPSSVRGASPEPMDVSDPEEQAAEAEEQATKADQHVETIGIKNRKDVSRMQYPAYMLQKRPNVFNVLLHAMRLGQEWMAQTYGVMELSRLIWHWTHQDVIRADLYQVSCITTCCSFTNIQFASFSSLDIMAHAWQLPA